ncbi:PREDICTED: NADH dehydrogenase [ubiquinone] 1 beta subcomplex subunit 9 [Ceratosolen solmsi marchali]|uniref:NADH dehydrogenase [ubiquinone] 1 beta subcomplex subunit 9 n=1 Tax=Ceratosolen solmsi marchali TaxID=326594 RepID=A0AAJ6YMR8_9HYME|nr:PREDICTED: NADH dehydrogenase [ubiquinone] 1 beta subcomplex subunit 9 [Ceratosolen solmsi marchali]
MAQIPSGLVSHSRKICNFYKRVIRHIESTNHIFEEARYKAVLIRHEFDKNKNIKNVIVSKDLLNRAEEKLRNDVFYDYIQFPQSPKGVAYCRDEPPPDWVLDYWHPMEKAMYPKYFALREQRKIEYEEFYKKEYGEQVENVDNTKH